MAKLYLKAWRDHAGLTQEQAGERIGVSHAAVQRWENSKRGIPSARLPQLATAYGASGPEALYSPPPASADRTPGNPSLTPKANASGAKGGPVMNKTKTIVKVSDLLDPKRLELLENFAWDLLNDMHDEGTAKTRPTKVRRV